MIDYNDPYNKFKDYDMAEYFNISTDELWEITEWYWMGNTI